MNDLNNLNLNIEIDNQLEGDDFLDRVTFVQRPGIIDLTGREQEDRYSRLRLIPWWDQSKLTKSTIMVVGAGALGNELLKNLALLGIGKVIVVDMDKIENSNLSRSILFRGSDEGSFKAVVAARRVKEINSDCKVASIVGDINLDIGLGVFRRIDVVLGGLDNREARLSINQNCWRANTPFVDGAIEVLMGAARVFIPGQTACYECTMNETDYKLLNMRRSCNLLTREEMLAGKVPTTPTSASVIAGIQVQEAVKILHKEQKMPSLAGKGYFYNGLTFDSYIMQYEAKEDCSSHDTYINIIELPGKSDSTTIFDLLKKTRQDLGSDAVLDLQHELVYELKCECCQKSHKQVVLLDRLTREQVVCPECGKMREMLMTHTVKGDEDFLNCTVSELGFPMLDIFTGRVGLNRRHYEISGDVNNLLDGFLKDCIVHE